MQTGQWINHGAQLAHHNAIADALPQSGLITLVLKDGTTVAGQVTGTKTDTRDTGIGAHESCGSVRLETPDGTRTFDFQEIESVNL